MVFFKFLFGIFFSLSHFVLLNASGLSSSFEVAVFDCGQGNTVAARYKKQVMFFDAGRKGYTKFVAFDDATDEESFQKEVFGITEPTDGSAASSLTTLWVSIEEKLASIDAGSGEAMRYVRWFNENVKGFIGDSVIEAVFISHPDVDHYSLVKPCSLRPRAFVLGGSGYEGSETGRSFMSFVGTSGAVVIAGGDASAYNASLASNNVFFTKSDGTSGPDLDILVKILAVNVSAGKDRNQDSMVVKLTGKHHSMIIPGDAEGVTWSSIPDTELQTDILLLSHHGAMTGESTTRELLEKIKPKACLISAGFGSFRTHVHPTVNIMKIILDYYATSSYRTKTHFVTCYEGRQMKHFLTSAPVFTTADNGRLTVDLSSKILKVNTARAFWPDPTPISLDDEDGENTAFYTLEGDKRKVITYKKLLELNDSKKPKKHPLFDNTYTTGEDGSLKYFYRYGTGSDGKPIYYEMTPGIEVDDSSD